MSHVFVSYSRKDSETVDKIVGRLDEDQFDTWIDRQEIHGGDLWREEIVEAIDKAYAFVLMLSPDSVASDNVRKEVDLAEGAAKALVPVLLAPANVPSRLRYQLAGIQWIEYYRDHKAKYRELVEVLRTHRPKSDARKAPSAREVEFVLKGLNLSQFGTEKQEQLLDFIAKFTGIPRATIRLEKLTAGSVHVFVKMPATTAYQIKTAALNRDVRFTKFGIDALRLTGDRHFVVLKTGGIAPPKSGKPGGRSWFIGGLVLVIAMLISSLFIPNILSQRGSFATTTPTVTDPFTPPPSRTLTSTNTSTPTPTNTPTPSEVPNLILITGITPTLSCSPTLTGLQNANCRIGPSTSYNPPYGTLLKDQTVDILGVNPEGTWFLVDHPQSFRYPCWVWNGPAVQVNGDLSCVQVITLPPSFKLRDAASEDQSSQAVSISDDPPPPYCSLYPILCSGIRIPILPPIPPPAIPN